jgi:hypothetical protein
MLTYELGVLLWEKQAGVADEMARLASFSVRAHVGPVDHRGHEETQASIRGLAGRSWGGSYGPVSGGSHQSMRLTLDSIDGTDLTGRTEWYDGTTVTFVHGHLNAVDAEFKVSDIWRDIYRRTRSPQIGLRFTDTHQEGTRQFQLGGDYRALLQPDMTLVGLWYERRDDTLPIGEFLLKPVTSA